MRVAVADIGTNSTRLLVADVPGPGGLPVAELVREARVTRLGDGLEASGRLDPAARERVHAVLADYVARIEAAGARRALAVMTSAVRDAADGAAFAAEVTRRHGFPARILTGDEEARATFDGATAARRGDGAGLATLLVADIGGGSTELVTGGGFHVSTQIGVVRHGERHLGADPPPAAGVLALRRDVRAEIERAVPAAVRAAVTAVVAVAGTATSLGAMELALDPYDPDAVEGLVVPRAALVRRTDALAALAEPARRAVPGLHPDRAPTIVAGLAVLIEVLDAFGLDRVEVSDRDLLWGIAAELASSPEVPANST
jgi:exopolyphosphatase/guanosine-5'-triphosphate,3'-diphosphate pyrophosphatase